MDEFTDSAGTSGERSMKYENSVYGVKLSDIIFKNIRFIVKTYFSVYVLVSMCR